MSTDTSIPASAPVFWECPDCGFLTDDARFSDPSTPCPLCGRTDGDRTRFPPDRQRQLDERIRVYYKDHEREIVVLLCAALLEALLEDILDRILAAHGADVSVRSALLDQVRSIGSRVGRLFPDLTGTEFEAAASEAGFGDFPKRWRRVREVRNAFIHDTPYREVERELDDAAAAEAMRLLDEAYRLFVLLNNKFVADGLRGQRRCTDMTPAPHRTPNGEDASTKANGDT